MRRTIALILISLGTGVAFASGPLSEPMEQGWRAQGRGEFAKAAELYQEALRSNPKNAAAHHLLGICQLQLGKLPEGIASLERAVQANPQNRQALYTLVSTYIASSMLEEAQKKIEREMKTDSSPEAAYMRGSFSMASGDYEGAIRHLENARRRNPKLSGLKSMLGVTYGFANRTDKAIPMLEAALRENPRDGNATAFLGWLYKERDRSGEAATLLEQTVQERPGDYGALFLLAQLTQARGQLAEALPMLERVVAAQPEHRGAHVLLARLYQQLKRPEDAARERGIVSKLNAAQQAAQPGAN